MQLLDWQIMKEACIVALTFQHATHFIVFVEQSIEKRSLQTNLKQASE